MGLLGRYGIPHVGLARTAWDVMVAPMLLNRPGGGAEEGKQHGEERDEQCRRDGFS